MAEDRVAVERILDAVRHRAGLTVAGQVPLVGGMVADVRRLDLADGRTVVCKAAFGEQARLDIEATMVRHLHDAHPRIVPEVIYADPELLLQTFMPGVHLTGAAATSLGEELAILHGRHADAFGFDGPTLNGWFLLPNGWSSAWVPFFRDRRLRHCADAAVANGTLNVGFRARVERLCEQLGDRLTEPAAPTLLHGDLWSANILADGNKITGLLDPSVVYGHPELDLSHVVGQPYADAVFESYRRFHPIEKDFFEVRAPVYQVYTAIMHVLYFGRRYEHWLDETLTRSGV
ncbi:fructosamine kinase family protein [Actinopolymorpha singaporensis]|uniref:Fructosamine-3-kinase n=1 Tax=Actinopolymorpha singaporensis TaxID=117157 RepID=A0A1H1L2Q1_9ACTN|nr:fructosamine kinase family protein [Actinopolymorpha singaporensis]SDR68838.1 Fructosamine-3-kinase [Actinopolymorpha singaporensis]